MSEAASSPSRWRLIGPGLLVAATGVGAGDLIAAAVAGRRFGLAVLWIVLLGAAAKWVLNEGIARWQLATGETVIAGWATRLPRVVSWYFGGFLAVWSFLVAAALGSACGVAAKALLPALPGGVPIWCAGHAAAGYLIVRWGRFKVFERVMQGLIAGMCVAVMLCAALIRPDWSAVAAGLLVPSLPAGSGLFLLGVMGGVGGSVTLLCYGYWMREKGWSGGAMQAAARLDLGVAYGLTGLFGLAMIILAAGAQPADASGSALVLALADRLGEVLGETGRLMFLIGFWCAVFSSLLGVWEGVPYLFADWWRALRRKAGPAQVQDAAYTWWLAFLAGPPLLMQRLQQPLFVVVLYAVAGAFFMPFLASTLLVMNNRRAWVGEYRNRWPTNLALAASLLLFGVLFALELVNRLDG